MATKVLFFSESQGWSGGAKQLLRLAEGLNRSGWDVRIACPGDGEAFKRAAAQGFTTYDLHPREDYDVVTAWRLARLIEREGIDVLHAHHPRAHAVGLIASYLCRRAVCFLVTRRVSFWPKRNPFSRFKYASRRIDGFIAVAESIRQQLIQVGALPARVATIPSGVDLDAFQPRAADEEVRRKLDLPPGVPVVGKIANYGSWKGQDVALQAAAQLKREGRRAVFLFAGRDTDGPELKRKAEAAGLSSADVRLLGPWPSEDVPRLLSVLSLGVNAATEGEGLSGALREALAMGIPVVASDVGGNRELVEHRATGLLFPPGDASALARSIATMLDDRAGAERMAEEGRRRVIERCSVGRVAAATADFYRASLARRRGGSWRAEDSAAQAASTVMSRQESHESETTL